MRRASAGRTGCQSTGAPWTWAWASAVRKHSGPLWLRRRVPRAAASASVSSMVSRTAVVSTGCGLASTKTSCPWSRRVRTASSNRTVRRRLVYQYSASRPVVSVSSPVTDEQKGMVAARGWIPARARRRERRVRVTWVEWEA
ncbi:hypothetical protein SFUMM280S_01038 [Streptomyces fumanus]